MKNLRHIGFRLVCLAQLILSAWYAITSLLSLFSTGAFIFLIQAICYFFIGWLPVFALSLFGTNYPDKPVIGSQKKVFNRLFIINFLLLCFLFAFIFREYRLLAVLISYTNNSFWSLPIDFYREFFIYISMLIFHLVILFGLYRLRVSLADNFANKKFEFEK
jgi:hypothetical protein